MPRGFVRRQRSVSEQSETKKERFLRNENRRDQKSPSHDQRCKEIMSRKERRDPVSKGAKRSCLERSEEILSRKERRDLVSKGAKRSCLQRSEEILSQKMKPKYKPLKMKPKSKSLKAFLRDVLNALNVIRRNLSDSFRIIQEDLKLINNKLQAMINQITVPTDKLESVESRAPKVETAVGSLARSETQNETHERQDCIQSKLKSKTRPNNRGEEILS